MQTKHAPDVPQNDPLIRVGNLFKAHGIRGEIKMYPETDDPSRLQGIRELYIGKSIEQATPHKIKTFRYQETAKHDLVLLQIEGVQDRNAAEAMQGKAVYVRESQLPPLQEDEFFLDDLLGLDVFTEDAAFVGRVIEWLEFPAQDLLVIERAEKSNALVPIIPEFIVEVDLEAQKVVIRPIEGLLD